MGLGQSHYSDSPYTVSDEKETELQDGSWTEFSDAIHVSLNELAYSSNACHNKYVVKVKSSVDSSMSLALLFPNATRRIIRSQHYIGRLSALSRDINERIKESPNRDDILFGMVCGSQYYTFNGIQGKMYLFWADVNITKLTNNERKIISDIPIVIETNGQMSVRNVFLFLENYKEPLDISQIQLHHSPELYVCDMDPRHVITTTIPTLPEDEVDKLVKCKVQDTLKLITEEEMPFKTGWTNDQEKEEDEIIELQVDSSRVRNYDFKTDCVEELDE